MGENRDVSIDLARCLMNYMIVVLHAWAAFQYVPSNTVEFGICTFVCSYLCVMAMPTFFLISGYLLFTGFSYARFPSKLVRRVKRLVIPYLVWNLTFVAIYLMLGRLVPRLGARVATYGLDSFAGALNKVVSITDSPIDGPLWFLRALFFMTLSAPLCWPVMKFQKGRLMIGLALVWCVLESCLGLTDSLHFVFPGYAFVCFVVGGTLAMQDKNMVEYFRPWGWLVLGVCALAVNSSVGLYHQMAHIPKTDGLKLMATFISILEAPALISLVSRMRVQRIVENCVFRYFKGMSFFVFAGHFLFCSMYLHTLAPLLSGMGTGKFTVLILIFVGLGVPTMALIYGVGRKLCPGAMKLWDGSL